MAAESSTAAENRMRFIDILLLLEMGTDDLNNLARLKYFIEFPMSQLLPATQRLAELREPHIRRTLAGKRLPVRGGKIARRLTFRRQ
jgi:hypothetical protein